MIRIGLLLLVLPCVVLMSVYMIEQSSVNDCLALGGGYDYVTASCVEGKAHEHQTLMQRHGTWVNNAMLLTVIGLFCCLIGLYKGRR
ncbi:MAG: hypothetical protein ACPGPF_01870 [Pontibacterium sp.]